MLNAKQLQWIKQRTWARYLMLLAGLLLFCIVGFSVPFFIIFSGIWQHSHATNWLLVLGWLTLLAGSLMAFVLWLMLILMWPLIKKSTKRMKEHTYQQLLSNLSAPELEPTSCSIGIMQIHKPFQYFPPTILSYFFLRENLNPMVCFIDGKPMSCCYFGEPTRITLAVGTHEIRMKRWILPTVGGKPKEVFCTNAVSIEIREEHPVAMVYEFKGERLLFFVGVAYLVLGLFSWDPFGWFDWLNIVLPYPWNAPSLCGFFRLLFVLPVLWFYPKWALKPVLEVIKPEDAPPSL